MKRETLKKHCDFLTPLGSPSTRCDAFVLKTKPAKTPGNGRFGVMATKKTFKLAVDRNHAKRLIRDWAAFYERFMLPDVDYIFLARPKILDMTRPVGRKNMRHSLQNISQIYKNNDKKE